MEIDPTNKLQEGWQKDQYTVYVLSRYNNVAYSCLESMMVVYTLEREREEKEISQRNECRTTKKEVTRLITECSVWICRNSVKHK